MTFYDQDVDIEDEEPVELPEVWLSKPGPCCTCGGLDQRYGCFRCGSPVCMDATNYMKDSACGGWIMDWWSNGAKVENEFWCRSCLEGLIGPPTTLPL